MDQGHLLFDYPEEIYLTSISYIFDFHVHCTQYFSQVTEDFRSPYKDNVVIEIVTLSGTIRPYSRKTRSLMQAKDEVRMHSFR